jgi:hypothetical protein
MKITFFLLLLFAVSKISAQDFSSVFYENHSETEGLKERNLKGKIKTIRTIYFMADDDPETVGRETLLKQPFEGFFEAFDQNGRLIAIAKTSGPVYIPVDEAAKTHLLYHENGALAKITRTDNVEIYNQQGDIVEDIRYDFDSVPIVDKYTYQYNASGKKLVQTKLDYRKSESITKFRYDVRGNLIEIESDATLASKMSMQGKPSKMIYGYDLQNRIVSRRIENPRSLFFGSADNLAHTYGKNGLLQTHLDNSSEKITIDWNDGRIIKKTTLAGGVTLIADYRYENDLAGNWVKLVITETIYRQGTKPTVREKTIVAKEIKYYE